MNLHGWDTLSATSLPLVNEALSEGADQLVTAFRFNDSGVSVAGRFGAWQIVEGGSMQLLQVALPIEEGQMEGLRASPADLAGVTLVVEVALRLLPSPDGDRRDLMFSFSGNMDVDDDTIRATELRDPDGKLAGLDEALCKATLLKALNAHSEKVAFVFASIKARGTASSDWLQTQHTDWANIRLGSGRQYLVILGSIAQPTAAMRPDKIDPKLFAGNGEAYFAISHKIFYERLLSNQLNSNFKPKTKFAGSSSGVQAKPVRLPAANTPLGRKTPMLDRLNFRMSGASLGVTARTRTPISGTATVFVDVNLALPFRHSGKTGEIGFLPDKKPRHKSWVRDTSIFKFLSEPILNLFLKLIGGQLDATVNSIAGRLQHINTPSAVPAHWLGVRDFFASKASLAECFWFCDTRPFTPKAASLQDGA